MKTLTFILYFVAILGLIEANWRVTNHKNFSSSERSDFLRKVRSAMSQSGRNSDKMEFLVMKMEQKYGNDWRCFYDDLTGVFSSYKYITVNHRQPWHELTCFETIKSPW